MIAPLKHGLTLASLAAVPVIIGWLFFAEQLGAANRQHDLLVLGSAWAASVVSVALGAAYLGKRRGAENLRWFWPCQNCQKPRFIAAYRCSQCRSAAPLPPASRPFQNLLRAGLAMFYLILWLMPFLLK